MNKKEQKEKKITWKDVFDDFKKTYPNMSRTVITFDPHSYATVILYFPDRVRMTYNYDTKELKMYKDK